jgi:hypothetical protein
MLVLANAVFAQQKPKPLPGHAMLGFVDGLPWMKMNDAAASTGLGSKPLDSLSGFANFTVQDLRKSLGAALESFMPFQFKYAMLLNESVEKISNVVLYKTIDQWYGTRYRYGGTSTRGIDCSAFMQVLSSYAFGWMLPRTAREQYRSMSAINYNELREGDFVFFNTRRGISHVGMYLRNGRFVHSSSSHGVSIGDLNHPYWRVRFIAAKRVAGATPGFSTKVP